MATDNDLAVDELRALAADCALVEERLERRVVEVIRRHRSRGVPWSVIAAGLGVPKPTAHRRWADPVRAASEPAEPPESTGPVAEQGALL